MERKYRFKVDREQSVTELSRREYEPGKGITKVT